MVNEPIKRKISQTRLFSDTEKIELLVRLDELSDDDRSHLEETIDGFDAQYAASAATLKNDVQHDLDALHRDLSEEETLQVKDALTVVQSGLSSL